MVLLLHQCLEMWHGQALMHLHNIEFRSEAHDHFFPD